MTSDDWIGIAMLLGVFAIALAGGSKNANRVVTPLTPAQQQIRQEQSRQTIESQVVNTQRQVDQVSADMEAMKIAKTRSPYYGLVSMQYISHSQNANEEYISLYVNPQATSSVVITGWTLKSVRGGEVVTIPQGTYLIFPNSQNSKDNIILTPGDTAYVNTGISPNGHSFKLNICSGYMNQFQTYNPSFYTNCPAPRNENLSSIPDRVENNTCFDYIDRISNCRIQTDPLPKTFSTECQNFILTKINYGTCINTHKNDKDFYQHTWYVYLGRNVPLWKNTREDIVLLDTNGKIVSEIKN